MDYQLKFSITMKIYAILFISLIFCVVCSSEETSPTDASSNTRKHRSLVSVLRIPTYHSFRRVPSHKPRILNSTPAKIINHHYFCDHTQHSLPNVDHGISFLPIPNQGSYYEIKLQPSVEVASIDLDTNKHLDNFEVNLPAITTGGYKFDSEVVTPLMTGTIHETNLHKQKYNVNLDQLVHYLSENNEIKVANFGSAGSVGAGASYETNKRGEFLNLPNIRDHPLEHEPGRSSYNSPGAVNSYGDPVHQTFQSGYNDDTFNSFENSPFGNSFASVTNLKSNQDDFQSQWDNRDIVNHLNHIDRVERQVHEKSRKASKKRKLHSTKAEASTIKYPNHRYE
ncbi:uncharacterized protein LOC132696539 [Cylas formicarius]|uniref:uncharacterized protein LOC132696539 n=1 Tax=Cylas formicarius TaxID=197179 RepID=UPI00295858C2|nr:uncharacterized protein LOC132696539 [Cylas formicarius]